jgi:EAL domain-containing protein (putative c-di-GMP-specific phosphodiesterase class I)
MDTVVARHCGGGSWIPKLDMQIDVQNKLRDVLTGSDSVEIGQFKWVNLEMVREQAGEDWSNLRGKIYDTSAKFIERRLGEHDVLLRCQGGFMIIFSDLEGDEAADKVEEISLALNVFFLGDKILRNLKIEAEARSITTAEFMQIVSTSVALDQTSSSMGDEEFDAAPTGDGEGRLAVLRDSNAATSAAKQSIRSEAMGSTARLVEPDWTEQEREIAAQDAKDRQWEKTQLTPMPEEPTEQWRHADNRKPKEKEPRWRRAAPPEKPVTPPLPESLFVEDHGQWDDIVFKPSWDSRQNRIAVHFCLARRQHEDEVLYGRDTLLGSKSTDLHRQLDRAVAIAAQRAFQQQFVKKITCAIGIPVHYDTIAKVSDRVAYFSILQSVPQKLRKFFFFRIDGIPKGAPVMQMQEVLRSMKGFGSSLLVKLDFADRDLRRFEGCGVDEFGCEMPRRINDNGIRDEDVAAIYEMVASAQLQGAETYFTDVDDYEAFNAAISTGVRYISGKIIGREEPLPRAMRPYSLTKIRQLWEPNDDEPDVALI